MDDLDITDRRILHELDKNSGQTMKALGKKIRKSKETIAYRLKRLTKEGYVKNFLTTIHISNVNRFYYKLFYKFHKTTPIIEQAIIKFIQNHKGIAYFASLEGRYDITFLILSKNMEDLQSFLIPFRVKFGDYVLEQEILTMTNVHRFNFRFFYTDGELIHTKYPEKLKEHEIDELDYLIIKQLAQNSRIKLVELAKQGKTDINVIKYRIKKLKKADILGRPVLDIRFNKLGVQQIQVDFSLRNHEVLDEMIRHIAEFPQTTFATVTLGKYDLAAEFAVRNTAELRELLGSIKEKFAQDIVNYDVFIMEEHSINWFPF